VTSLIVSTPGTCGGKPRISGTRIRVQDIAIWTEQGMSADEIVTDFPHLTLAGVYSALAYYHDHRDEIEQQIREAEERATALMSEGDGGASLPPR